MNTVRHRLVQLSPMSSVLLWCTTAVGIVAFTWPFFIDPHAGLSFAHGQGATWVFAALLPLLLLLGIAELRDGTLDVKTVALLAILAAVGTVLRIVGSGIPGGEPLFALIIISGRSLGRGFGYLYGATVLVASALATGFVGPWLPFQMVACAWVGAGAGCLPALAGRSERFVLAAYGAISALAYGAVMDLWFWPYQAGTASSVSFVAGAGLSANLHRFATFYLTTSLGFDLLQAVTNVVLLLVFGSALLTALDRAGRRAAFGATPTFVEVDNGGLGSVQA